jgi:hypothetical protein
MAKQNVTAKISTPPDIKTYLYITQTMAPKRTNVIKIINDT